MREMVIAYLVKNTSVKDFASYRKLSEAELLERYAAVTGVGHIDKMAHLQPLKG